MSRSACDSVLRLGLLLAIGAAVGCSDDAGPPNGAPAMDIERSSVAADSAPSLPDADYATFIANSNAFGLALGQKMVDANHFAQSNVVYSPLSVTYALGMTYAGARGETASELKTALGDTFADGEFHTATNRLARELRSRVTSRPDTDGGSHKIELNVADAIFVERSLELQSDFLDLLSRDYDSGAHRVDYLHAFEPARKTINDWVADQTKGKILDLLPEGSVSDQTRIVLVNALYFYGSWRTPFRRQSTSDAAFHPLTGNAVQVPTMHAEIRSAYATSTDSDVAELAYEGDHLRMTIVLPAEGKFESVRAQVSSAWLKQSVSNLAPATLEVALPKFKFTAGTFSLKAGLEALGVKRAFSDTAELSGISSDAQLSLSDVVQKAFIAVDENGAKAAAATAAVGGSDALVHTVPFVVDRPFLFFIRDDNDSVLFSGQVVNPAL